MPAVTKVNNIGRDYLYFGGGVPEGRLPNLLGHPELCKIGEDPKENVIKTWSEIKHQEKKTCPAFYIRLCHALFQ